MSLYPDEGIILQLRHISPQFFKSCLNKNSAWIETCQHFNYCDAPPNIKGLCLMSTQQLSTETFFKFFTESEFYDQCTQKIFSLFLFFNLY